MVKKISSKNKNNKLKIVSNNENIKSSTARLRFIVFAVLCIFSSKNYIYRIFLCGGWKEIKGKSIFTINTK